MSTTSSTQKNVLGEKLLPCSSRGGPTTGFYRDGFCKTGAGDVGSHCVCAEVTEDFLQYTAAQGNDLSTPRPGFAGLKPGDRWCLCTMRWLQAERDGKAPPLVLECTNEKALKYEGITMELLEKYRKQLDDDEAAAAADHADL